MPCEDVPKLEALLEKFCCAWELEDPSPEEYPDVPVKLKNNRLTWPLNMVTEMYSLPAYDGVDPNPLMAPFFILFYGIMMADMGYGLLMILASIIITKKSRPKGTSGQMFGLMFSCGISTFIMGALTGGFFGDFLPQLAGIINPNTTFKALPSLFTPLDDTITILIGAMALGFVQIVTGMAISFVEKLKKGEIMDAIWEELTWWVVFAGIACMALGVTNIVLYVGHRHGRGRLRLEREGLRQGHGDLRLGLQPCDGLLRRYSFVFQTDDPDAGRHLSSPRSSIRSARSRGTW